MCTTCCWCSANPINAAAAEWHNRLLPDFCIGCIRPHWRYQCAQAKLSWLCATAVCYCYADAQPRGCVCKARCHSDCRPLFSACCQIFCAVLRCTWAGIRHALIKLCCLGYPVKIPSCRALADKCLGCS